MIAALLLLQETGNGSDLPTDWPEAAVAIAAVVGGIALVAVVVTVLIWQVAGTWRARMSVAREEAYKRLAQETSDAGQRTAASLDTIARELAELRARTSELERMLKEVE